MKRCREVEMAKIYGLELKNIKHFAGDEGECYQGNLYIGSKKIASWSQDSHGALEDRLSMAKGYSEAKLRSALEKKRPKSEKDIALECTMSELVQYLGYEKIFKKATKQGYSSIYLLDDGFNISYWMLNTNSKKDAVGQIGKKTIEAQKEKMLKNCKIEEVFFSSEDQFDLYSDKQIKQKDIKEV